MLIKGINLGVTKPGYFPGDMGVTKDDYLRWFQLIGAMNVNAIRVYTLHPPSFYEALLEYNSQAAQPIYLFHGIWVDEEVWLRRRTHLPAVLQMTLRRK